MKLSKTQRCSGRAMEIHGENCKAEDRDLREDTVPGKSEFDTCASAKYPAEVHPPASAFDKQVVQLAAMTAGLFNAPTCLLLLLDGEELSKSRLKLYCGHRQPPRTVCAQCIDKASVMARQTISVGKPIMEEHSDACSFCSFDGSNAAYAGCMIAMPICVGNKTVGAISVRSEMNPLFNADDMQLVRAASWFVGQSLRRAELENLLDSQFAQLAVAREAHSSLADLSSVAIHSPAHLARTLAKSFYREMIKVGLSRAEVINAASEIISQVSAHMKQKDARGKKIP